MNFNPNIFRAYDIRGIAYKDLTEEVVSYLGKSLGTIIRRNGDSSLILARDGRNSSPNISKWFSKGIKSTGCNIINIGIAPTPVLYFSTHKLQSTNGVMITGSHNPSDYNGFKIVIQNKTLAGESIQEIKKQLENEDFDHGKGNETSQEILSTYLKEIKNNISLSRPLKIAIDCGNGATSVLAKQCYEELGCEVEPLYCELDGNFPNHHPDPSKPENLKDLITKIHEKTLDVGLAFDGDGDRLGVVSSEGQIIFPDKQMILFSENILKKNKGSKIVFDVKCSQLLTKSIIQNEGIPIMSKTGHSFIKEKIKELGALLGGEMSGHIFFNDRWPGFDDAIYAGARMLEIISQNPLGGKIFQDLPTLSSTPEINLKAEDSEKFEIVEKFKNMITFPEANIVDLDGIRIEFENGWGLLRASNTSPVLVLRFEAKDQVELEKIKNIFKKTLEKIDPELINF